MKTVLISIFGGFFLLSLLACHSISYQDKDKPNIVLINIDDLGWKDLSFMGSGYYQTPHIDQLAKEGMVFMRAYASASNCAPSRASMLSGLNTPRHGIYTVSPSERGDERTRKLIPIVTQKYLSNESYTLADMLKSVGYRTASIGKWHIGKDPTLQGIDVNIGGSTRGNPGPNGYFSPYSIDHIENGPEGEYLTDRLTDEAISFIEKSKDTTFFLYLPYYTVHTPIMGKESKIDLFKNKKGVEGQNNPAYAAMISSMDDNIGRLLSSIKARGLEENTLVIFTSDNGGIRALSHQHPLRAGKGSYYEGGIRVPLIIKWPKRIKANTISEQLVSNLDFFPTLQAIVKPLQKAPLLDGIDLTKVLISQETIDRKLYYHFPIYLEAYNKEMDGSRDPLFRTRPGSVVLTKDWKLHYYYEDKGVELYNLKTDTGETINLVDQNSEKAKELFDDLNRWLSFTHAAIPTQFNEAYNSQYDHK